MKIFLYYNASKAQSKEIAIGIREYLNFRGITVVAEDDWASELDASKLSDHDPGTIDFSITLGGDGTMLRFVHYYPEVNAPIFGVNLGSLGFMADVPLTEIYSGLQELLNGNFTVEERLMMEGGKDEDSICFGVNDITFHRASNLSLIDIVIHVDGSYLNTFTADGVILSTPCGSTAYSLAAGGPILSPEIRAFILTPISPHTISNRPIVFMPKKEVQVQYISNRKPIDVSADAFAPMQLHTGEVFFVRPSKRTFKLVKFPHHDYFSTLRTKLGWSGKLRSS